MPLLNGNRDRIVGGLGAVGGLLFGMSLIYGAAATVGLPLPRPAFDVDMKELRQDMEGKYEKLDRRLGHVEDRQIEGILVTLRGQLRTTQNEISEAQSEGRPVPQSALRERDRLQAQIRQYELQLTNAP